MYRVNAGFKVIKILDNDISEEKSKVFKELDVDSLEKILKYCYANICGRCNGTDCCYYYIIVNYVHEEFRQRRRSPEYLTFRIWYFETVLNTVFRSWFIFLLRSHRQAAMLNFSFLYFRNYRKNYVWYSLRLQVFF